MAAGNSGRSETLREDLPLIRLGTEIHLKPDKSGQVMPGALAAAAKVITKMARLTASYLRQERFTGGTTDTRLRVRTGRLRASVREDTTVVGVDYVEGGTSFGTVYARVHVGPKGQVTTIRPRQKKMLAIPLPAAMTPAGVPRGTPLGGPWGETFIRASKSNSAQAIIYGKQEITKGPRTGRFRQEIVPLFVLMRSVQVKARVHPEEILAYMEPKVRTEFQREGIKII